MPMRCRGGWERECVGVCVMRTHTQHTNIHTRAWQRTVKVISAASALRSRATCFLESFTAAFSLMPYQCPDEGLPNRPCVYDVVFAFFPCHIVSCFGSWDTVHSEAYKFNSMKYIMWKRKSTFKQDLQGEKSPKLVISKTWILEAKKLRATELIYRNERVKQNKSTRNITCSSRNLCRGGPGCLECTSDFGRG